MGRSERLQWCNGKFQPAGPNAVDCLFGPTNEHVANAVELCRAASPLELERLLTMGVEDHSVIFRIKDEPSPVGEWIDEWVFLTHPGAPFANSFYRRLPAGSIPEEPEDYYNAAAGTGFVRISYWSVMKHLIATCDPDTIRASPEPFTIRVWSADFTSLSSEPQSSIKTLPQREP